MVGFSFGNQNTRLPFSETKRCFFLQLLLSINLLSFVSARVLVTSCITADAQVRTYVRTTF
jgi:hypothetical protein